LASASIKIRKESLPNWILGLANRTNTIGFFLCEESHNQAYYLGSAAYAYAFLVPPNPVKHRANDDPRLLLAVDIDNRGVALRPAPNDGEEVDLNARQLSLLFGSLDLAVNPRDSVAADLI